MQNASNATCSRIRCLPSVSIQMRVHANMWSCNYTLSLSLIVEFLYVLRIFCIPYFGIVGCIKWRECGFRLSSLEWFIPIGQLIGSLWLGGRVRHFWFARLALWLTFQHFAFLTDRDFECSKCVLPTCHFADFIKFIIDFLLFRGFEKEMSRDHGASESKASFYFTLMTHRSTHSSRV